MSSPTNLTDSITRLRNRKDKISITHADTFGNASRFKKSRKASRERRFATDFFMLFAYSLLGIAILAQFFLIVWLAVFRS